MACRVRVCLLDSASVAPTTGSSCWQAQAGAACGDSQAARPSCTLPVPALSLLRVCGKLAAARSRIRAIRASGIVAQAKNEQVLRFIGPSSAASTLGHLFSSSPWRVCVPVLRQLRVGPQPYWPLAGLIASCRSVDWPSQATINLYDGQALQSQ